MEDKFTYINDLFGFYGTLLSQRQQEIIQYYYGEDLSLSEIADNLKISRNAVFDALKKAEDRLVELEDHLHLFRDYQFRMDRYSKLMESGDDEIKKIAEELIRNEEDQ
ncbi:MAG: DNA-binding protein [Erysipelotrichaceae bacterium]|nr:DNA-binding protein [Erysipelotrichaceae bacterium]